MVYGASDGRRLDGRATTLHSTWNKKGGGILSKLTCLSIIIPEDVAILEEPEHLNWFRMPNSKEES